MILTKEFKFEASHQLPFHRGKCRNLHGHSWKLTVAVEGSVQQSPYAMDQRGMVMDYTDIKLQVQPLIDLLDHKHFGSGNVRDDVWCGPTVDYILGVYFPNNPTSEELLIFIANWLAGYASKLPWVQLELNETCTSSCILTREDWLEHYATDEKAQHQEAGQDAGRPQDAEKGRDEEAQRLADADPAYAASRRPTPEVSDDDIPF